VHLNGRNPARVKGFKPTAFNRTESGNFSLKRFGSYFRLKFRQDIALSHRGLQITVSRLKSSGVLEASRPPLQAADIHLWEFPLAVEESVEFKLRDLLSEDERARAARFHFERDARRFQVARGAVRSILASYSGVKGKDLHFSYTQHGKPRLSDDAANIRFSISHSGERGLLAVAAGREVGADIEAIKNNVEFDQLAKRFFSEHEKESLLGLSPENKIRAFYRGWTCKEAFLKAQGVGLSRSLASFDVELTGPARLLATRPDADEAEQWSLFELQPSAGYAAALAVEGTIQAISHIELPL
jgi:4'-phosphopantetheinyl transferase